MKFNSNTSKVTYSVILSLLILAVCFSNCKKNDSMPAPAPQPDPKACFTSDRQSVVDSQIVTFNNCSTNASSYDWDFGDGTSSTISALTKLYSKNGTYTVTMTATGNGKKSTATQNIFVGDLYLDKVIVNKLTNNGEPLRDHNRFRLTIQSGSAGEIVIDTTSLALPFTIPVPQQYKLVPGDKVTVDWLAYQLVPPGSILGVGSGEQIFAIGRSEDNVHGYNDSQSDMYIGVRVQ